MGDHAIIKVESEIAAIASSDWDICANLASSAYNPFISHAFLAALEESGCVSPQRGWLPQHLVLQDCTSGVLACMPCYLKSHSQGEYVFDHGWADAFERAGGHYYPKLQSAIPFTPVTGRRFLVPKCDDALRREQLLLAGAIQLAERQGASSLHATFVTEAEWHRLGDLGLLRRNDRQFHWLNNGYISFNDFLASLASRKRKAIRRERREATATGVRIEHISGGDISEDHWDAFYQFYMDTGSRKWGTPYLIRTFFSLLGEKMSEHILLVMCRRAERYVAGALNIVGGDTLYGRYWGCLEYHNCLHFEVCYYQAIDFAIAHGLARVEAGAQGEHKLARGYLPKSTYSLHWIANASLQNAVSEHLENERKYVALEANILATHTPFKKQT